MTPSALALHPKQLYALGAWIPNDGRITWFPAEARGFIPLNAYLLTEGDDGLVVDTGLPVVESAIASQAKAFALTDATVLLTRNVEFDSIGNAEVLTRIWPVRAVYAHFTPHEWIHLRDLSAPAGVDRFASHVFPFSDQLRLTMGGDREVVVINSRLKLLATAWVYDPATRVLFTSDSFSHVVAADAGRRVVTADDDHTSSADVYKHLLLKFDWLDGADTTPLRRFLDDLFTAFDVETIAPSHGCILEGRAVVERHYAMVDAALRDAGLPEPVALGEGR